MLDRLPGSFIGKLFKYSKPLKEYESMLSFTGRDEISIFFFLESYKTFCGHSDVNEGLSIKIHT